MLTGSLILNRLGHHHYLTQICFEALQIFLKMEKEAPGLYVCEGASPFIQEASSKR